MKVRHGANASMLTTPLRIEAHSQMHRQTQWPASRRLTGPSSKHTPILRRTDISSRLPAHYGAKRLAAFPNVAPPKWMLERALADGGAKVGANDTNDMLDRCDALVESVGAPSDITLTNPSLLIIHELVRDDIDVG